MNRREFLTISSGVAIAKFPFHSTLVSHHALESDQASSPRTDRPPVLVRAGFTRRASGTEEPTTSQQTVVRSLVSEGRLAVFVVPVGEHEPYRGAPLHVHHEQDEWIHIMADRLDFGADECAIHLSDKPAARTIQVKSTRSSMSGCATYQDLTAWSVDNFRFADHP
jgi:hypothetical protein